MPTFDLAEVRGFAADLDAKMDRCDNGEGMECSTLDAALVRYADMCCKFRDGVREWGRAVFTGRVGYDPDVEFAWIDEAVRMYNRATVMWTRGQKSEGQTAGTVSKTEKNLAGEQSRSVFRSLPERTMHHRIPIPLKPALAELNSPEFSDYLTFDDLNPDLLPPPNCMLACSS